MRGLSSLPPVYRATHHRLATGSSEFVAERYMVSTVITIHKRANFSWQHLIANLISTKFDMRLHEIVPADPVLFGENGTHWITVRKGTTRSSV